MKTKAQNKSVTVKKDGNTDSVSELQSRPEQLSSAEQNNQTHRTPLARIDYDLRRSNRELPTDKVLNLLRSEAPRFFELAEVVGHWVWIQFTDKQPREITAQLAQFGFHWNNKRGVWQHPCGQFMKEPASYDPRERYGSKFPADLKAA